MKSKSILALALLATVSLSACGLISGLGSKDYGRGQVRGEQTVRMGVVDSVRSVKIEGTRSGAGAVGGGVLGGVAGSTIGGGKGKTAATVIGAIGGAIAGAATEQAVTKQEGVEITVLLDGGKMIAVTQAAEKDVIFTPGERVRVLSGEGVTRVAR